jgi:hypothetical protein
MDPNDLPTIHAALAQFRARAKGYALATDYYEGNHRLAFATRKFHDTFGWLFSAFADNLCASVVDALADRLALTGFGVDGAAPDDAGAQQVSDDAWAIWNANRMDRRSGMVHLEAPKTGDAYVIVWPNREGSPRLDPQRANEMTVRYDPEEPGVLRWAVKAWREDDGRVRLNLYYPDRIVKYITRRAPKGAGLPDKAEAFEPYQPIGETWPLANEWGVVPVFAFANNAGEGELGQSELRDVIPLQDALNKAIADMLVAMEFVALPQRWITGWTPPIDPDTKQPVQLQMAIERFLTFGGKDIALGQFPAADLSQFLKAQDSFRQEIAAVSRTPLHFIVPSTGTPPSGEALKTAESPLLAKVADRQVAWGNRWEDCLMLALRMSGYGDVPQLSARWKDATPRDDAQRPAEVQALTAAGATIRGAAIVAGYSEEQADLLAQADLAMVTQ